jgi:flagellar biosynthetic protein FliO
MDVVQQGLALVVVFGILGGAVWLLRSRQLPSIRMRGERRMQVVERVSLTPNHTLCLVKVGGRLMMIGTAPSSCHLIETVEDKVA